MSGALSRTALRRALAQHRRLLAGGLAAGAVAAGLTAVAPAQPATVEVVAAARDLAPGAVLGPDDLAVVDLPAGLVPQGALTAVGDASGRLAAGAVRTGEPLTDVRLLGGGLLPPGADVAAPLRVAEPATAALVRAGDVVDVLAAAPDGGASAVVVARGLRVLTAPLDDGADGALLVVATTSATAARLAAAAVTGRLSVVVHGR